MAETTAEGSEEPEAAATARRLTSKVTPTQLEEIKKQNKFNIVQFVERKDVEVGNAKKGGVVKGNATKGKQKV